MQDTERKYHSQLLISITLNYMKEIGFTHAPYHGHLNSTYVIDSPLSFTLIINDMNRTSKKNKSFTSKKPYRRPKHGPELATSTSTSTGTTDLMLSIPDCDFELDGTISAQVVAGVSVSFQLRRSHL